MARQLRRDRRDARQNPRPLSPDEVARASPRAPRSASPPPYRRPTSTPSRATPSRGSPATSTSSDASAPSFVGTPRRWSPAPTPRSEGIGGHLSTFASSASLYEVGFNHFFRGKDDGQFGDQVFFQGHAAPGIYAARLPRRPTRPRSSSTGSAPRLSGLGLSSYPHPAAHAGVLGVPDRLDGPRPAAGDLPGALQPLPR